MYTYTVPEPSLTRQSTSLAEARGGRAGGALGVVVVVVGCSVDVLVVAGATVVVRTGVALGAAAGTVVVGAVVVGATDGVLPPHAVSTPLTSNTPAPRTIGKASRRPAIG